MALLALIVTVLVRMFWQQSSKDRQAALEASITGGQRGPIAAPTSEAELDSTLRQISKGAGPPLGLSGRASWRSLAGDGAGAALFRTRAALEAAPAAGEEDDLAYELDDEEGSSLPWMTAYERVRLQLAYASFLVRSRTVEAMRLSDQAQAERDAEQAERELVAAQPPWPRGG